MKTYTTVVIGDEILIGQVTDTNSGSIARILEPEGWAARAVIIVGDNASDIRAAIERAMAESDLVLTTGGLGPTKDDITRSVLLDLFGGTLVHDEEVARNVARVFERRGLTMNASTASQAMVPSSCRVIQNELGTAPIMWFEKDGKVVVSMPGVPFETVGMMRRAVAGEIARHFNAGAAPCHHTVVVEGITESDLSERLADYEAFLPYGVHLAYLPTPGLIRLRLDSHGATAAEAAEALDTATEGLRSLLGPLMIHDGDATAAEILLARLRARGYTVATAESCTGGNIAHSITAVAGCSDCYAGGVVAYSNEVKMRILGVDADTLDRHGAVSRETVEQMAAGACRATGADCAMATSGIAGPGGAVEGKPVGTVWIAVATPQGVMAEERHFPGDRSRVIDRATTAALMMLVRAL